MLRLITKIINVIHAPNRQDNLYIMIVIQQVANSLTFVLRPEDSPYKTLANYFFIFTESR